MISRIVDDFPLKGEMAIAVWRFCDAPSCLKKLSHHGGDEDWVAYIPPCFDGDIPIWLDPDLNSNFGVCDTQVIPLECGSVVLIGAHS